MLPLTTLQAGWQIAKNMPWRLITELLGVIGIILLALALKSSYQETGKWKTVAEQRELDLQVAILAIQDYERSQRVTDETAATAGTKKEQHRVSTEALLKEVRDKARARCPVVDRGVGNEGNKSINQPAAGSGIGDLKRVLDVSACLAKGRADCAPSRTTP